eukprot:gene39426-51970_t
MFLTRHIFGPVARLVQSELVNFIQKPLPQNVNPYQMPASMTIENLAHDIDRIARIDGDHTTAIPQLSLHRRSLRTEPMPCIYGLGLAVVAQGGKQVTVGEQVLDYGSGQSLLITADLPVVAHVTRADLARPFMCLFLALDARALMQQAAEMDLPPVPREEAPRAISLNTLDTSLLDATIRLVRLLDEPALVPSLAPLIQQEIMVRLLSARHSLRRVSFGGSTPWSGPSSGDRSGWPIERAIRPLQAQDACRASQGPQAGTGGTAC